MFHLTIGNENHHIIFHVTSYTLSDRKHVPLFVFRGIASEGEADTLYAITSLENALETLGEPISIGYRALWNLISNNWCTVYAIRASDSMVEAIDKVIAEGVYPDVDALVEVYSADVRETLSNL